MKLKFTVTFFSCADPALCFSDAKGNFYVNPNTRMAFKADCSIRDGSNCKPDMTYKWEMLDARDEIISEADMAPFYLNGNTDIEVSITKDFFNPGIGPRNTSENFKIGLRAKNGDDIEGTYASPVSSFYIFIEPKMFCLQELTGFT